MAKRANEFGAALCDLLDVDPELVRIISIVAEAEQPLSIDIHMDIEPSLEVTEAIRSSLAGVDANVTIKIESPEDQP
jgi:hypothetical protein